VFAISKNERNNHKFPIDGVTSGYHTLCHHGQDEDKLTQLRLVETSIVSAFGDLPRLRSSIEEGGSSLLDQTSVLLTSNLGNASSHDNRNMPVLFGGGGFKHAGHLAFDPAQRPSLTRRVVMPS
jgi:hypothetical protein